MITDRLLCIEAPRVSDRPAIQTKDVADRWLRLAGKTWAELSAQEYARLISRSSQAADELNQRFRQPALERVP